MQRPGLLAFSATLALTTATFAGDTTSRQSVDAGGTEGDNASLWCSLSHNGRWAAFPSWASNLVAGDTNGRVDIFLRDRSDGTLRRVSQLSDGTQANGDCCDAVVSAEGDFVVFTSMASNLVPGDTNGASDVFRWDAATRSIIRVSTAADGSEAGWYSGMPDVSADGRFVSFESEAANLVPGDTNRAKDVFRKDLQDGSIVRVSVGPGGVEGNGHSYYPSMSDDGRYVAFNSQSSNLVANDTNGVDDVFRHDVQTATTDRVSISDSGTESASASWSAGVNYLSETGGYCVFTATGDDLDPRDSNGFWDIYVRDLSTGTTDCLTILADGTQANGPSDNGSISADGSRVAFETFATNLFPGDTNGSWDVLLSDAVAGVLALMSLDDSGTPANDYSFYPTVSADGLHVGYASDATNLVPGDTNGCSDTFVRGTEFNLDITPRSVKLGAKLNLTTWGGAPNTPALLYVAGFNGSPILFKITTMQLDAKGRKELSYTVPVDPALDDSEVDFVVFGIGGKSLKIEAAWAKANLDL